jgi:diguanylate cyclase (GGDEF)-like protein
MFPLQTPYKGQRAVTAQIINITERRNLHKKLRELSYIDPLTGLYNRRYFLERVRMHLMEKGRAHIMLCDIDRFKDVNDQYGHLAGDAVLKEFAAIAKEVLKHNHAIARLGGDEFVMALTDMTDEEAFAMGESLRKQVEKTPFHYQTQVLSIHISIGIARLSYQDLEKSELIADADRALYQAKASGKNRVCLFDDPQRGL